MSDIYADVPVESDTTIIFENTMKFGSHDDSVCIGIEDMKYS